MTKNDIQITSQIFFVLGFVSLILIFKYIFSCYGKYGKNLKKTQNIFLGKILERPASKVTPYCRNQKRYKKVYFGKNVQIHYYNVGWVSKVHISMLKRFQVISQKNTRKWAYCAPPPPGPDRDNLNVPSYVGKYHFKLK